MIVALYVRMQILYLINLIMSTDTVTKRRATQQGGQFEIQYFETRNLFILQ